LIKDARRDYSEKNIIENMNNFKVLWHNVKKLNKTMLPEACE